MKKQHSSKPASAKAECASPSGDDGKSQFNSLMRLMSGKNGKAVQFEVAAFSGSKVYVVGTFNNWDPTTHPLEYHPEDEVFRATLHLPAGTYEYKFVVDGVWHIDYECPHWVAAANGAINSVIHV
jgi:1,4-alpha-glucan branching enzyme